MDVPIWAALLGCLAGCYFAACNVALKTFSKARMLDLLEHKGHENWFELFDDRTAKLVLMTGVFRAAFNLIVLIAVFDAFFTRYPHPDHKWLVYALSFLVAGVLVSVFMVAIPTSWARYHPERLLVASHRLLYGLLWFFLPLVNLMHLMDPVIRRITGVLPNHSDQEQISDQVMSVVEEHREEGRVDQSQRDMLEAVFELPSITAGEIMTPRTDVHGIEVHATLDEVKTSVLEGGHSRIPVYEESLDHLLGVLYAKDLIHFLGVDAKTFDLRKLLRDVQMVPESKPIKELLTEFKLRKVHMAIVIDEYGGTAGLVTIEDILEEIVGDIQDEYEPEELEQEIRRLDDNTFEVDARVYVDDLNDKLGVSLPEDEDYDTLGGFVISTLGNIPSAGDHFEFENLKLTVTAAERTKVSRVKIERIVQGQGNEAPNPG